MKESVEQNSNTDHTARDSGGALKGGNQDSTPMDQQIEDGADIFRKTIKPFLQEPPTIFKNFHHDDVTEFLEMGELERYQKNDVVISDADYVKSAYLVAKGEVAVWRENIQLAVLSEGAFLGETFLFSKNTRMAKIVSTGESSLLRFDRPLALSFFRMKPSKLFNIYVRNIIELQQGKINDMNNQIFSLKKRMLESGG